jgi:desulfoferrodoxin (superoxide reductase-like protein)
VGAVDHPDTPERYLAKVRVYESGEAERERLRQQVAKFRV